VVNTHVVNTHVTNRLPQVSKTIRRTSPW